MSDFFGGGTAVAGVAQAAAMVTVAILQYKTWDKQIDKQDAIARRIQDRADEQHALWQTFYRPHEIATVNEVTSAPLVTPAYGAARQRVRAQYLAMLDTAKRDALRGVDTQCVGARGDVTRAMDLRAAGLTAFGVEAAMRAEENRAHLRNRERMADRLHVLADGRNVHHSSVNALQGAISAAQFSAQQAAGAFNGAVSALGALARRSEQRAGRQDPAPTGAARAPTNVWDMPDPRAQENGYGAFPQPGSGDSGGLQPAPISFDTSGPLAPGADGGSGGAASRTMDTNDYGGSI